MINKFLSFFKNTNNAKRSVDKDLYKKDSAIDIIISLTNNGEIDLSVYIDTDGEIAQANSFDFAKKCAEFLNVASSSKLRSEIMNIIIDQIRNEKNKILVEDIVILWDFLEKKDTTSNKTYILPSQVFSKYSR